MVTLIRYKVSKQKVSKVIDNVSKRTISMLAKELSVNVETIRFYERKGLIKQPPKPMQGYRHYPKETVNRIHFIKRSQELGFTLNEIEGLLALNDSPCSKVQELASYDEIYANNLYEVYMHNSRIKKGTINEDVAVAKSDRAKQKMYEAKNKILKKL